MGGTEKERSGFSRGIPFYLLGKYCFLLPFLDKEEKEEGLRDREEDKKKPEKSLQPENLLF